MSKDFPDEDTAASTGVGSGRAGDMGTPSSDPNETAPGVPQEENEVVSGGGLADQSEDAHD